MWPIHLRLFFVLLVRFVEELFADCVPWQELTLVAGERVCLAVVILVKAFLWHAFTKPSCFEGETHPQTLSIL